MKVKYIANTQVCLNVNLGNGSSRHISFNPITGGKSVFYTEDTNLQDALERHYKYGKLFKRDGLYEKAITKVVKATTPVTNNELAVKEVKVSDLGVAKEYLVSRFGATRTKVRTKTQIQEFAKKNGVVFIGI